LTEWCRERVWGETQEGSRKSKGNGTGRVSMRLEGWTCFAFLSRVFIAIFFVFRYRIRGDDEEWDQVLKKAGNTAVVSIKRCGAVGIQSIDKEEMHCLVVEVFFFLNLSHFQQWQEEEMGRGGRYSEQWGSSAWEIEKEGTPAWKIQEEQGQTWKIWKEGVTDESAAVTGLHGFSWTRLQILRCTHSGYPSYLDYSFPAPQRGNAAQQHCF